MQESVNMDEYIEKMYHLFPFDMVEKGTDIILYGYGSMGRQYVEQINKTGYCRIQYIVDKNWDELKDAAYEIKDPNVLRNELNPCVVITTGYYADEVKTWLNSIGIPDSNIISKNIELDAFSREPRYLRKKERDYLYEFRKLVSIKEVTPDLPLVRIGRNNDGGYLMLNDFHKGGIAYSFGISNDVSWDKAMADCGYDVFMYDHTISALPEENDRFHWEKIGVASDKTEDPQLKSLEELIFHNGHSQRKEMILKMDVEGAEWGCFSMTNSETLAQFDQIVLELHEIIQFRKCDEILSVLQKIYRTHQCIHVHFNNLGYCTTIDGVPYADCVEVTFVRRGKYSFMKSSHTLPHICDQPCGGDRPEIILGDNYCA